ncbi:DUF1376 domain-containing protein [Methylobacterium fujisawaense]|uniref:DUF1376 domain-containing protein n=1 Tax=Methylobacterium fujisawaense TaxID=107400 RepID=UPI0031F5B3C3
MGEGADLLVDRARELPPLHLATDALIADTTHFSAREIGAYLLLLIEAWRSPNCRLPDEDAKLADWARLGPRAWITAKPTVMSFWALSDGFWSPSRQHFGAVPRAAIAPSIRARILAVGACAYCGDAAGPFEVDHVVPLARGGPNIESNLACACVACNRSKRDHMLAEWVR